jgi:hypothetical protein
MLEERCYMPEECGYMPEERSYMPEERGYMPEERGYMEAMNSVDATFATQPICNGARAALGPITFGEFYKFTMEYILPRLLPCTLIQGGLK